MGRRPARLGWIKLHIDGWLDGTTRDELEPDERSVWCDIMALAGRANDHGWVHAPVSSWPRLLNISKELRDRTITKCTAVGKITVEGDHVLVVNYDKYQPERYERFRYDSTDSTENNVAKRSITEHKSNTSQRDTDDRCKMTDADSRNTDPPTRVPKTRKPPKTRKWITDNHKPRGQLGLVLLTDDETAQITQLFGGEGYTWCVRTLEGHIVDKPDYPYNHANVIIRKWVRDAWEKFKGKNGSNTVQNIADRYKDYPT
jgi:hypothetical protein